MTNQATEKIKRAKHDVEVSRDLLLKTFAHVPDDKLNWSPSPTARTPLQIASHCGGATATFAGLLRGEPWPFAKTAPEAAAQILQDDNQFQKREEAVQEIESAADAVIQALNHAPPATLETSIWSPFGEFPYTFAMAFPANHMTGHTRQIDYLQTIWDDREDHN